MKPLLVLTLAASCLAAHADPVYLLRPDEMHFPLDIAHVQDEGDVLARAAGLASLRPVGEFELRLWTLAVGPHSTGEGTAWVFAKGRLAPYELTRLGDRLRAVRTSSRRIARGVAPAVELRAAWEAAGRRGCNVADATVVYVEASLDGAPIAFSGQDLDPDPGDFGCRGDGELRLTALLRRVHALARR